MAPGDAEVLRTYLANVSKKKAKWSKKIPVGLK
jgi:hypothetical protein